MNVIEAIKMATIEIKKWTDDNKVSKVYGMGLSANSYTTAEKKKVGNIPDNLVILDGKLYLTRDGIPLINSAVTLSDGGPRDDIITIENKLLSTDIIVKTEENVVLEFEFDSNADGATSGTSYVFVDGELIMAQKITFGNNTIDITKYTKVGVNSVKLICMDNLKNYSSISYIVTVND